MAPRVFAPVRGLPGRFPVGMRRALEAVSRHFWEQKRWGLVAGWVKPVSHDGQLARLIVVAARLVALIGAGSLLMEGDGQPTAVALTW